MKLALVGLPGAGKSTVGRGLASRLRCDFIDSDEQIERRIGCSIRSFFEAQGEDAFRDVEKEVLSELLMSSTPMVLATGGGVVLLSANRQCLRAYATVVYLHCLPDEVFARLRHDHKRPLLQVNDPLLRLQEIYAVRHPLYEEVAHDQVEAGHHDQAVILESILDRLPQVKPPKE